MAFLSKGPLTLNGGCFCSAIRYTISIPELEERPLAPGALPTPVSASTAHWAAKDSAAHSTGSTSETKKLDTRFPFIDLDHCHSCRRACGSLLQCWFICPIDWIEFKLIPRKSSTSAEEEDKQLRIYPTLSVVYPSKELQQSTYVSHYCGGGESGKSSERTFCGRCGTGMSFYYSGDRGPDWTLGPVVDIALGTLDQESFETEGVRPERHGWWQDGTE